jgi:hypothetical protein
VIPVAEDLGDLPTPENGRTGVVGVLEESGGEALVPGRGLVAEDPGQEPGDGLDDHDRRHLPPGQDVVADGELTVDKMVGDPFVDPFVTATEEGETPRPGPGR